MTTFWAWRCQSVTTSQKKKTFEQWSPLEIWELNSWQVCRWWDESNEQKLFAVVALVCSHFNCTSLFHKSKYRISQLPKYKVQHCYLTEDSFWKIRGNMRPTLNIVSYYTNKLLKCSTLHITKKIYGMT